MKYLILLVLLASTVFADMTTPPKSIEAQYLAVKNLLNDPGFEMGAKVSNWDLNTGTEATTSTNGNFLSGKKAFDWNATASGENLVSNAFSVTNATGIAGQAGVVSCAFKVVSGTATHTIQAWDGTSVLASTTITSSTTSFTRTSANFMFPSTGTIRLRVYANANEPQIYIDDCYLGLADGYNISQAQGTPWNSSLTFTPVVAAFGNVTSSSFQSRCVGDTLEVRGYWLNGTVAGNTASITLPTGYPIDSSKYPSTSNASGLHSSSYQITSGAAGALGSPLEAFYDGSTTTSVFLTDQSGVGVYVKRNGNSCCVSTGGMNVNFKYATSGCASTTVYSNASALPASWSGYHDNTCVWNQTSTGVSLTAFTADASCVLVQRTNNNFGTVATTGAATPGITFTPSRAGRFGFCANGSQRDTVISQLFLRAVDGAGTVLSEVTTEEAVANTRMFWNMCGVLVATSTAAQTIEIKGIRGSSAGTQSIDINSSGQAAINWTVFALDQNFPAPSYASPPTVQKWTTGSSTYTAPPGVKYIRVRMVGQGGGGAGSGTANGTAATAGTDSVFTCGTQILTATGGAAGARDALGALGGVPTLGTGPFGTAIAGGQGGGGNRQGTAPTSTIGGGQGGASAFGSGGSGGVQGGSGAGVAGVSAGSGGGGGSSSTTTSLHAGAGGGAGGFIDAYITSGFSSCTYAVGTAAGAAGGAGASGFAGGAGAAGYIEVTEYYQ